MELDFDQIATEMIWWIGEPTTDVAAFEAARHPLMTSSCPNIPALEKIARGQGTLRQSLHRNVCAYCQKSVTTFRKILDIRPWWEELQAATANAILDFSEMLVVEAGNGPGRRVKTKVLLPDSSLKPITVNLAQCRFSGENQLWMLLELEQTIAEIRGDPLELTVLADNGQDVFGPYVLPALNRGHKETVMLLLPSAVEEEWRKKVVETTKTVPFQFVLRPFAVQS